MDATVTFQAFEVPEGNGPNDIRIVIPKNQYLLVAEDDGCYYVAPIAALSKHAKVNDLVEIDRERRNG